MNILKLTVVIDYRQRKIRIVHVLKFVAPSSLKRNKRELLKNTVFFIYEDFRKDGDVSDVSEQKFKYRPIKTLEITDIRLLHELYLYILSMRISTE